ncbi:hypothetical protein Tsp_05657 [Trichinella spiralis]|uniref:hypothetical protein n=1 Tax=Trichinella spiralis TaxID=6334 RepID=UPI0001EFE52B|nr:hypothetical protein Tsp_05657 [Trichinella spiralis]
MLLAKRRHLTFCSKFDKQASVVFFQDNNCYDTPAFESATNVIGFFPLACSRFSLSAVDDAIWLCPLVVTTACHRWIRLAPSRSPMAAVVQASFESMLVIRPLLTRSFVTSISDVSLLAPSRRTPPPQFTYNVCRLERRFLAGKIENLHASCLAAFPFIFTLPADSTA